MRAFRSIAAAAFLVTSVAINALGSMVAAAPGKADAPRLRWKAGAIKIAISNSVTLANTNIKAESDVLGAIRRSLKAWQSVADIEFQTEISDRQNVSPSGISGDGVNLITIAQTPENVLLFSKNPLSESAKTRIFYNRKGFITEADIVLNPFLQFSTDGTFGTFDLESTLTHEIGHLLGLRHSADLGAVMSDSQSRNGAFGVSGPGVRTLSESDVAAIRELYGSEADAGACCAAINGRLSIANTRGGKNIRVWAEESGSGRVLGQTMTSADGSFKIGGLTASGYTLFWQRKDDAAGVSSGELDTFRLEKGETKAINEKIVPRRSEIALNYVGLNSQLAESGISLTAGREYVVYLGGKNLDPRTIKLHLNSRSLNIDDASLVAQDFGDKVSVISFVLTIDADAPDGSYSIFVTGEDGSRASLIGAVNVVRQSDGQ